MDILQQFFARTPAWVWILLVWLVLRGIKARTPATVTLGKLAVIPVIFTVWGISDLLRLYGLTPETGGLWLAGIAAGAAIGWRMLARVDITADRAAGVLHRPADFTLLPLLLATFAVKYAFAAAGSVSPELMQQAGFRIADLVLSGLFTGIFIGKFMRYLQVWRAGRTAELPG